MKLFGLDKSNLSAVLSEDFNAVTFFFLSHTIVLLVYANGQAIHAYLFLFVFDLNYSRVIAYILQSYTVKPVVQV